MAARFVLPREQVFDANGHPLAGAKLYFYTTGTTTPLNTYSDAALTTPNANPVVADSAGLFPDIYMATGSTYKAVLKTSADVTMWTSDPAPAYLWLGDASTARSSIGVPGIAANETITGQWSFQNGATSPIEIRSVADGATVSPTLDIVRDSESRATSDVTGSVSFISLSNGSDSIGSSIRQVITDAATQTDKLVIATMAGGAPQVDRLHIGAGAWMDGATGGDKGIGTFNALAIYSRGQPVAGAYVRLHDANAASQAWTLTTWTTVRISTEAEDAAGLCALASNQITLTAGTYYIRACQAIYGTEYSMLRLRNTTAGTTLVVGRSGYSPSTGGSASVQLDGTFTVAASQALELQLYPSNGESAGTLTFPGSPGENVQQNVVEIWRLS